MQLQCVQKFALCICAKQWDYAELLNHFMVVEIT